jgi:hypothetical protein
MRRMKLWQLGALNFLAHIQLNLVDAEEVDFAYVDLPAECEPPLLQTISPHTGQIVESRPCLVWTEGAIAEPKEDATYGFAGHTKHSLEDHPIIADDVKFSFTKLLVCFPLSFIGARDDLLLFKLPAAHPGHDVFSGCSGAPIVDLEGNIVALVGGGHLTESLIFGISLRRYQIALDVHVGRFGK